MVLLGYGQFVTVLINTLIRLRGVVGPHGERHEGAHGGRKAAAPPPHRRRRPRVVLPARSAIC